MLIQNPPAAITDRLWMLGTGPYPLFLYGADIDMGSCVNSLFNKDITHLIQPFLIHPLQFMGLHLG